MGQSTDAIFTYGFQIEEDSDSHEICESLRNDRWEECSEAEKELGIKLISHCSCDYPMYVIGSEKTTVTAHSAYPKLVQILQIDENMEKTKIRMFCDRFGIEFNESGCGFWLQSDWS